jgi:hypothetical protein
VAPTGSVAVRNPFNPDELPSDHVEVGGHRLDNNLCFDIQGTDLQLEGPNPMCVLDVMCPITCHKDAV